MAARTPGRPTEQERDNYRKHLMELSKKRFSGAQLEKVLRGIDKARTKTQMRKWFQGKFGIE